jgi:hypothetical protein
MRWLKYLNWQGKRYDVRKAWVPVATTGHFDHIHLSSRSDALGTSLSGWSITGDAMELTDTIHFVTGKDVAYDKPTTTVEGVMASTHYYVLQSRNLAAAQSSAILDAVKAVAVPEPAPVDAATLKAVLLDPEVLAAMGRAVLDEQHRRDEG